MKKIILIIFTLSIVSCVDNKIVVKDNCQYIETTSYTGQGPIVSLTHSGSCNNPIHNKTRVDTVYIVK